MIILISYNKINHNIPVEALEDAIKTNSLRWWHHLNETWIVRTNKSINEYYNCLAPYISTDDRILLIEIKRNYQGWLNQSAWDWIKKEFKEDSFLGI